MSSFIHDDFLLHTAAGKRLYHDYAVKMPIIDYHCHLSPILIAENHRFSQLQEAWLATDPYKWRAMRTHGIAEQYCSGMATPREKFQAWAETVPKTLGNPLFHWTHLELARYFGITELLTPKTAASIWQTANAQLQSPEFSPTELLHKMH